MGQILFVLTFVLFIFISVKTKKINARKEDSREWPKSIEGENHGDKTNVSGPNHRQPKLEQASALLHNIHNIRICMGKKNLSFL